MSMQELLRRISTEDLLALGVHGVAYVRPVAAGGETVFVVHAADGSEIDTFGDLDLAVATMRLNGLDPMSLH